VSVSVGVTVNVRVSLGLQCEMVGERPPGVPGSADPQSVTVSETVYPGKMPATLRQHFMPIPNCSWPRDRPSPLP